MQELEPRLALAHSSIDVAPLLAATPGLDGILHAVFGNAGTAPSLFDARVATVEQQLLSGPAALGVNVRVLNASVMGVHEGGYSASAPGGPTIYVRSDLLQAPPDLIRSVLIEELGHHIDVMLNGGLDSPGDEGELFSALVRGAVVDDATMRRILTEDDHGTLVVDGGIVAVEFATVSSATTSVSYTEASRKISLQPSVTVGRATNESIRSVSFTIGAAKAADRISVPGSRTGQSSGTSPFVAGLNVPPTATSGTFYLGPNGATAERWDYSITTTGEFQFRLNGIANAASVTAAQRLLRAIQYDSTSNNPVTTPRTFAWAIGGTSSTAMFNESVTIVAVNNSPTVSAASPSNGLIEAGAGVAGTSGATIRLTKGDVDGTVSYDNPWLLANGWSTANGGASYTRQGTYGTATLTIASDTVGYQLNDALAATQALTARAQTSDSFTVRVIDNGGATATAMAQFAVTGSNDAPTVSAASPSNGLVEAGAGVAGTSTATIRLTKGDVDGTVNYDRTWLTANGWSTTNGGVSYTRQGTYGTATLTIASNTVGYVLTNALAATQALAAGARASDSFTVRVIDNSVATALATAQFAVIGSNDAPFLSGTQVVLKDGRANNPFTVSVADLLVGFSDWEADGLSVVNLRCTSAAGTIAHRVVANGSTSYTVSPVPGYSGAATLSYEVRDTGGAVISATNQFLFAAYTPPTLTIGAATPPSLVEAGGIDNAFGGVPAAVVAIQRSGASTKVAYDGGFLAANGWTAVTGGYLKAGTYGAALLDTTADTLTYVLDNMRPATESLRQGQGVDDVFTLQVNDGFKSAKADAVFHAVGTNDGPRLLGTKASFAPGTVDVSYVLRATDLLTGFVDPDGGALIVRNPATSSGTIVDRNDGTYVLTPGANHVGEILVSYDIVDDFAAARRVTASLSFAAVTHAPIVKNFVITSNDIAFLDVQTNVPIVRVVRYETDGTPVYGYTDPNPTVGIVTLGTLGSFDLMTSSWASFLPQVVAPDAATAAGIADPFGLRNVQGLFNNLSSPSAAAWGAAFSAFARNSNADYSHYATGGVDLSKQYANPFVTVSDSTPRMISQTADSYAALERVEAAAPGTITDHAVYQITDITTGQPMVGGYDANGNPLAAGLYFRDDFVRNLNTLSGDPTLTGWSVLFGQFLDHGLDFIGKGGNTTSGVGSRIVINLDPADPLYDAAHGVTQLSIPRATVANPEAAGPDGMFRTADDVLSPGLDGKYGTADDVIGLANPEYANHTSPYIDQSQTYGSDDDVTNLLREWVKDPASGHFVPGMYLFDGTTLAAPWERPNPDGTVTLTKATLPTLNELRAHVAATGRDDISWSDIGNLRVRDASGHVLDLDATTAGLQAKLTDHALIADLLPRLDAAHLFTDPLAGIPGHVDLLAGFAGVSRPASGSDPAARYASDYLDIQSGRPTLLGADPANAALVAEILLRSIGDHYVAGDGRVNENFGLTSIHHIWHENHNWQLDNFIESIRSQQAADPTKASAHAWQVAIPGLGGQPLTDAAGNYVDGQGRVSWNMEKMFQMALFINQMEYQHVAIDQYARGHSPNIPLFVMYDSSVNPDVTLDYSQVAFRFGHSQLREVIDTLDPHGSLTAAVTHYALEQAFLDPAGFAKVGPTAIAQGMSRQAASEIDEFVTPALQQKLLGQPQDLAAINIARGRDLGMATLNNLRRELSTGMATQLAVLQKAMIDGAAANGGVIDPKLQEIIDKTIALQAGLQPYVSWADFGNNIQYAESLPNFIAAYSFNGDLAKADAVVSLAGGTEFAALPADQRAAVESLGWTASDASMRATAFMGIGDTADKGFEIIDAWNGGLAEKHVYLGELGSTFDTIFCDQMTRLINGDRDYYFWRLRDGLSVPAELINAVTTEQFKDVIERTTGARHLNGNVMFMADSYVELGENPDSIASGTARQHKYGDLVQALSIGVYSDGGKTEVANGSVVTQGGVNYILDARPDLGQNPDGTPTSGFNSHEVIGGTPYADFINAGDGDDTIYGDAGNDLLIGNAGADHVYGEAGDDVIYGGTLPDFLDGGTGNDEIHGGDDADVVIGADGNDRLFGDAGIDELQGNAGDDYIDAGSDVDFVFAGSGQDVVIGGEGLDTLSGEYGDDRMFGGAGPDQMIGDAGDDILNGGIGGQNQTLNVDECLGEFGYNLVSFSDVTIPLNRIADLNFQNVNMGTSTPFGQLWVNMQGVEGSPSADQIIGDAGNNWLIGGGQNDFISGGAGDDVIVADSMRLDTLIGTYGANGKLQENGILDAIKAGDGKHFQDLLRSVPNFRFGDIATVGPSDLTYRASANGTGDTAVYAGNRLNFDITPIYNPANPAEQIGIRVVDRTGVETSSIGDVIFGAEKLLFGYDFTAVNAASTGLSAHVPLTATTLAALGQKAYDVNALLRETTSPLTATLSGFAAASGDVPTAASLGITNPANTLVLAIPTAAAAAQVLGFQWQWFNTVSQAWVPVAGANAASFTPSAGDAIPLGSMIRGVAEFIDAAGALQIISSSSSAPLGQRILGTNQADVLVGTAFQDVIYAGDGNDTLTGGLGADMLVGGAGADTFRYTGLAQSTADSMDVIYDFTIGTDIFDGPVAVAADQISRFSVADSFSIASLESLLASAAFAASGAALVTFGRSTDEVYLVLNDGIAGYSAATDGVIRIKYTGMLDNFAVV